MELPSSSAWTLYNIPEILKSIQDTKDKKKRAAAAAAAAAAAKLAAETAENIEYEKWERTPRKLEHIFSYGVLGKVRTAQLAQKQRLVFEESPDDIQVSMLQMKIDDACRSLEKMKSREKQLLEKRLSLWKELERHEIDTWENVNVMLKKYERLTNGIRRIHYNFQNEYGNEQKELFHMKETMESKIKDIENELSAIESLLETENTEYTALLNFQHEAYPIGAMIIEGLQNDVAEINQTNEQEKNDFLNLRKREMAKCQKRLDNDEELMIKTIIEESSEMVPHAIGIMKIQNQVMEKEINFLLRTKTAMEKRIKTLIEENKELTQKPLSYRMQMFPQFFPRETKCDPEADILLDIPQKTYLSI